MATSGRRVLSFFDKSQFTLEELKNIKGVVRIELNDDEPNAYEVHGGSRTAVERLRKYRATKAQRED